MLNRLFRLARRRKRKRCSVSNRSACIPRPSISVRRSDALAVAETALRVVAQLRGQISAPATISAIR